MAVVDDWQWFLLVCKSRGDTYPSRPPVISVDRGSLFVLAGPTKTWPPPPNSHATSHCDGKSADISYSKIATMEKTTSSPQHPSNQRHNIAPSSWTNSSSWTPSKATALLPTSLPVSKPHKGWDRVPKAPVAQNSRVKQVWRREFRLRSQPNKEERAGQEEALEKARQRSPMRVVKKKRTRSPIKKSPGREEDDEGEPNHAPTRWENRRTSLRREWSTHGSSQEIDLNNV